MRGTIATVLVVAFAAGVLLQARPAPQRPDIHRQIDASTDPVWLERLATEPGAAEAANQNMYAPKTIRAAAYVRLGAIGSPESIAVARRIESAARAWPLLPAQAPLDLMTHPSGHFSDSKPRPFAQVTAPDGMTYGVIQLSRLGGLDAFLMRTETPDDPSSWSRPRLLSERSVSGMVDPALTWVNVSTLRLDFSTPLPGVEGAILRPSGPRPPSAPAPGDRQHWTLVLDEISRDSDGDGWTDIEERRLGTDPRDADSDDDGITDERDVCPRHSPSPFENGDIEVAIIQKVFFAGYGIHASPDVLLVSGSSRPVQLWGSRAPVLFGVDRSDWFKQWSSAPPLLSWKV